jgi:predicted RNase H-like nuclease (RuvC/YqgF family)
MNKPQFAASKILTLRQAKAATSIGEIYREPGFSEANDNLREIYTRLTALETQLRQLEVENGQLKKIASRLSLKNEMLHRKLADRWIKDVAG